MKTLLLIDANSIIHRSFHALPPFTAPDGRPTGALYGLASILLKLWREEKPASEGGEARQANINKEDRFRGRPDYAAACFDRPEPTFREQKYKEYKAQRPPAPDELISQIIEAHNLFTAFGIKVFEKAGYEADDVIATLAENFKKENDVKIVILTGDKDTLQLVEGEKVVVRTFGKGVSETVTYDEGVVEEKFGLKPRQLVDYKAFMGDASDNIKGVPGVGPKTASALLQKFGSLDGVFDGASSDPKLAKKIIPFRKDADLARELVTLDRSVPVGLGGMGELHPAADNEDIKKYFRDLGFATLIERVEGEKAAKGKNSNRKRPTSGNLFDKA